MAVDSQERIFARRETRLQRRIWGLLSGFFGLGGVLVLSFWIAVFANGCGKADQAVMVPEGRTSEETALVASDFLRISSDLILREVGAHLRLIPHKTELPLCPSAHGHLISCGVGGGMIDALCRVEEAGVQGKTYSFEGNLDVRDCGGYTGKVVFEVHAGPVPPSCEKSSLCSQPVSLSLQMTSEEGDLSFHQNLSASLAVETVKSMEVLCEETFFSARGQGRAADGRLDVCVETDFLSQCGFFCESEGSCVQGIAALTCGLDPDHDGIIDDKDNCPGNYNPSQKDIDANGVGDICEPFEVLGVCGDVTCKVCFSSDECGAPEEVFCDTAFSGNPEDPCGCCSELPEGCVPDGICDPSECDRSCPECVQNEICNAADPCGDPALCESVQECQQCPECLADLPSFCTSACGELPTCAEAQMTHSKSSNPCNDVVEKLYCNNDPAVCAGSCGGLCCVVTEVLSCGDQICQPDNGECALGCSDCAPQDCVCGSGVVCSSTLGECGVCPECAGDPICLLNACENQVCEPDLGECDTCPQDCADDPACEIIVGPCGEFPTCEEVGGDCSVVDPSFTCFEGCCVNPCDVSGTCLLASTACAQAVTGKQDPSEACRDYTLVNVCPDVGFPSDPALCPLEGSSDSNDCCALNVQTCGDQVCQPDYECSLAVFDPDCVDCLPEQCSAPPPPK